MELASDNSFEFERVSCFKCPKCEFVSLVKNKILDHLKQEHKCEPIKSSNTTESGVVFHDDINDVDPCPQSDNEEILEDVVCDSSNKASNGFTCSNNNCSVHLEIESNAQYHMKCHFESSFRCPECGENKSTWKTMTMHLWKDHSINLELLSCHLCSYKTGKKELLKFHVKTHSDQRTCLCDECGKGFKNMKQLRNHKVNFIFVVNCLIVGIID